jgi:hypothetical protein
LNNHPTCPQCKQICPHLDRNKTIDKIVAAPLIYCFTYICDSCGERLDASWEESRLLPQERELLYEQQKETMRVASQRGLQNTVNVTPTCQRCGNPMLIDLGKAPKSVSPDKIILRYQCEHDALEYGIATWDRNRLPRLEANYCRRNGLKVS